MKIFKGFLKLGANADINVSCLLNGRKHRIEEKHNKDNKIIYKYNNKSLARYSLSSVSEI